MLPFGMDDWTASSSDLDHEKENVEPGEKKYKSLKLNRKELHRWDYWICILTFGNWFYSTAT